MRRLDAASLVSSVALAALLALAGCGQPADDSDSDAPTDATTTSEPPTASTTPTATATATTTTEPTATVEPTTPTLPTSPSTARPPDAAPAATPTARARRSPVGTWRNREVEWVLRVRKSGRFVEDFAGVERIRSGTWKRSGKVVVFRGGDGVTTRGRLRGDTLTIRGTVLERVR